MLSISHKTIKINDCAEGARVIAKYLNKATKVVGLTGAGVSTESGNILSALFITETATCGKKVLHNLSRIPFHLINFF